MTTFELDPMHVTLVALLAANIVVVYERVSAGTVSIFHQITLSAVVEYGPLLVDAGMFGMGNPKTYALCSVLCAG